MKMKFCSLLVGVSLFALASAATAAEPLVLSDNQMDHVTAGVSGIAIGNAGTVILSNLTSTGFTQVATESDALARFFAALSFSQGLGVSVGVAGFQASHADSFAACTAACN